MRSVAASLDALRGLRYRAWIRESTKGQYDRHGPESQRENIATFVERYGLIEAGPEFVVAHSGRTVWRTADMSRLLDEVRAERFEVLLVGYFDRWQRNLRRTLELVEDELHPHGVAWVMADRRLVSGDPRDWDAMIGEAHEAERYSRRLADRIRDGYAAKRRQLADQGGGLVPLGFRRDDRKLVEPDPDTMPIAVRIWQLAASGLSDRRIAQTVDRSLWQVRDVLRSPLYRGQLADGTRTRFPAPIDPAVTEQALAHRRTRTRLRDPWHRRRIYPLSGHGPLVCATCDRPIKGVWKRRRSGQGLPAYRHYDALPCPGWPVAEVPAVLLENQVGQLLAKAAPSPLSAARVRAALAMPPILPDRLGIARLEARMRALALELAAPNPVRPSAVVLGELEGVRRERQALVESPMPASTVEPDEALDYLNSLGRTWSDTSPEGRRALAVATFARLAVVSSPQRGSHRIIEVEVTADAERRGLLLTLPTHLEVTMVGDTGVCTSRVTSWPVRIVGRSPWLAAARSA